MSWLKRDAVNRAWRTILQTLVLIVIAPAVDAAVQVLQMALVDSMTGQPFDWGQVGTTALYAAGSGVSLAVLAYVHRLKVDPSSIPSAPPPAPPPPRPAMATRLQ